jgi:predicted nucleic-acid-binding protein
MIGLDTNVLVRYVMQDDAKQSARATRLVESFTPERPGFIPLVALIEFVWVLSSCFDLGREDIARALDALRRSKEIQIESAEQVAQALRVFRSTSAEFADCLIERCAASAGCERTVTFDVPAAKSTGMVLLQ